MDSYFSKFPLTIYNEQPVVDITRRAAIANTTLQNPFLFYPIVVEAGTRSDQLARNVYGDPYQEWLIWMSNQIIDPYDSWYMDQSEFNDFLTQKYGSVQLSQEKIMYYKNNWETGEGITISAFDALDVSLLKYYQPTYNSYGQITGYIRTENDWSINTNHLASFNFSNSIPAFLDDEVVTITYTANNIGSGQVASFSNNTLNIHHVSGYYLPNGAINAASFSILGSQSNANITISSANDVTITSYDNLQNEEEIFYSPVYYYDYEDAKNESNKILNIMIPNYVAQTSAQIKTVLNE